MKGYEVLESWGKKKITVLIFKKPEKIGIENYV